MEECHTQNYIFNLTWVYGIVISAKRNDVPTPETVGPSILSSCSVFDISASRCGRLSSELIHGIK